MANDKTADQQATVQTLQTLKAQYASAFRKYSAAQPSAFKASDDEAEAKLRAAEKREREFFLQRLRVRLKDAGVSRGEIAALEKQPEAVLPAAAAAPARSILKYARTAMLVIHGIGEQDPYETLDQFARNLTRYLRYEGGIEDLTLSAQKIDHNESVEAMIRLETAQHGPQAKDGQHPAHIDVYEYYWAPETEDKISYLQTIYWLIRTTLTPIRMLDQNVRVIEGEPDSEKMTRGAILGRELRRIAMLYIPLAVLLFLLTRWLPSALNILVTLKNVAQQWNADHPYVRGIMTVLFVIALVMYWVVLKQLLAKVLRWMRQQTAMVDSWVTANTFIAGTLATVVAIWIGHLFKVSLTEYFKPVLNRPVVYAVLSFAIAWFLKYFLADYVGDVAVYVNVNARAKNYAVRCAILSGATTAIDRILKDEIRDYENVIVAGHSLGSVIAYDSLNELMNRCLAGNGPAIYATPDQIVGSQPPRAAIHRDDLGRIKGLVTFGSPLDKVYYFFRQNVPESQSVRAQILSLLRSFDTRSSNNDYGIYKLQHYLADQLSDVTWLNAWSKEDPVSGMLHFYTKVIRQEFTYLIPVYAHLSYWEDLRFYAFIAEPLLFGRSMAVLPRFRYVSV